MDLYIDTEFYISDAYCDCFEIEETHPILDIPSDRDVECGDYIDQPNATDGTADAALRTKDMR